MKRIYADTSIMRHIGRIGDEANGWNYGDYEWAYRHYGNKPELVSVPVMLHTTNFARAQVTVLAKRKRLGHSLWKPKPVKA